MARIASARRTASRAGPMISSRRQTSARIFSRIFMPAMPLGREPGFERAVDLLDVEVDHRRLASWAWPAAPGRDRCRVASRPNRPPPRSSRRTPHSRRRASASSRAQLFEADSASSMAPQLGCAQASAQPPRAAAGPAPARRRSRPRRSSRAATASRHRPSSRRRPRSPAGSASVRPTTSGDSVADRVDQQALADHLAAEREEQDEGPVVRNDPLAEQQREREKHQRARRARR